METKKLIAGLAASSIVLSIGVSSAFADESTGNKEVKTTELRKELKAQSAEKREIMKENRSNIKDIKGNHRDEYKGSMKADYHNLDEAKKAELKAEVTSFRTKMSALKEEFKTAKDDEAKKAELKEKLKTLIGEHHAKLLEILGQDSEVALKLKERQEAHAEMMEKKSEIREKIKADRSAFMLKRSDTITKYKTAFINKLGDRLEKISSVKLEKISDKLSKMYDKTEANDKISDESKELLLSKITALQDVINLRLEQDDMDVNDLLNIVE